MNKLVAFCAVSIFSLAGASAFAAPIYLNAGAGDYVFDSTAGTSSSINELSFDYSYGTNVLPSGFTLFRIRNLSPDGAALKVMTDGSGFKVDSDYGPYYATESLSGPVHFDFTLNRSNGLWDLAINGSTIIDFTSGAGTSLQPDGLAFSSDRKYYSDESDTAVNNAAVLGMSTALTGKPNVDCTDQRLSALCGVGGTGNYELQFRELATGDTGAFVDTIQVSSVPEPESLALVGLALAGLAISRRRRKV